MAPQTIDLPAIHPAEVFPPGLGSSQTINLPAIHRGFVFAPTLIVGSPEGLAVRNQDGDVLDEATDRGFVDENVGAGNWRLTLPNDDPDMPDYDDIVTFELNGRTVFGGIVETKDITTHDRQEEAAHLTRLRGAGRLAITKRGLVRPSRGLDAAPVESTRSWFWGSFEYDDSGWPFAKRIRRASTPHPYFPYRALPEWWPDKSSWWVAPNIPSVTGSSAPVGKSPYRFHWNLPADATIDVFIGMNNLGPPYFDGIRIGEVQNNPPEGYRIRIEDVSAGDHVVAGLVSNFIRDTGLNCSVWTVDDDGLLDELVAHTDSSNTRCLPYPPVAPGFTPGEAVRLAVEQIQDVYGELLDLVLDFTDHLDSAGRPWAEVREMTVDVGRSLYEMLLSFSSWLVDVEMAPGSNTLRMWAWGTRGRTPGVSIAATSNPDTHQIEALNHNGRHTRVNHFDIRYHRGGAYTTVTDSASVAIHGRRPDFLDLSDVDDEVTAQQIGRREMEIRSGPSYARTLTLKPGTAKPYDNFGMADYVTVPDEAGGTDLDRVLSIEVSDKGDDLATVLRLNDIRTETELRHENWLQRTAPGTLAGGARATTRGGEPIGSVQRISAKDVARFSISGPLSTLTGDDLSSLIDAAATSGNLIECHAQLTKVGTTSTVFQVWRVRTNTVLKTVTIPAYATEIEVDLAAEKTYRNVDKYQIVFTSLGAGAEGLVVQLRAI